MRLGDVLRGDARKASDLLRSGEVAGTVRLLRAMRDALNYRPRAPEEGEQLPLAMTESRRGRRK